MRAKGQVLVEALIGLTLLLLIMLLWQSDLQPQADRNQLQLASQRENTWARQVDATMVRQTDQYAAAKATGRLLSNLNEFVDLGLETRNLRQTRATQHVAVRNYPMARVTNTWAADTRDQLAGRPRLAVVNSFLANDLVTTVQDALGWLPMAKELHSRSLIFGHIDTDVVPKDRLVKLPSR